MHIPAPNRRPFDDDGPLPDLISGLMWLATAAAGVAVPARGVLFLVAVAGQAVTVHEAKRLARAA